MLYLFGNCQMDFLQRALAARGVDCGYRALASPLTTLSTDNQIPPLLKEMACNFGLEAFMHDRRLVNQFLFLDEHEPQPTTIVINLFHENEPLFTQRQDRYIFYLDPEAWRALPGVERWMKRHCEIIKPNPATYLGRFERLLGRLRERFTTAQLVLVTRLTHHPAFGPRPFCYLNEWELFQDQAPAAYTAWAERYGCRILDMDRVFAGIWADTPENLPGSQIATHCPFLRVVVEEQGGVPQRLELQRDIEHIGSMWPRLADKIQMLLSSGEIRYNDTENPPAAWARPAPPERLGREELESLLRTGGNYPWARAVAAFFQDPAQDYCQLLAAYGPVAPVCHNLLHMIDKYSRIHKNPQLALWCRAHRPAAMAFDQNGPQFKATYLERIGQIENRVARRE